MSFIVTKKAQRPAKMDGRCFYCNELIGSNHKLDCVLVQKKVKIKMTVEYEVDVPSSWNKENIEFHRNEGTWCSNNAIDELETAFEKTCMCGTTKFKYIKDISEPYLSEE